MTYPQAINPLCIMKDCNKIAVYNNQGEYNPDEYLSEGFNRYPSYVKRSFKLKPVLDEAMNTVPEKPLTVKYMFYDEKVNSDYEEIDLSVFKI